MSLSGLFVGQLSESELAELERGVRTGEYRIVYRGASGFMGLGRVERANCAVRSDEREPGVAPEERRD